MNDSLEARVARLEDFIGNIDQIRLYANSLQEVIDKYLAPLYIESGSGKTMLIDGYLGDLTNIPHNIIFKIRASHDLEVEEGEQALIRFKRQSEYEEFTLRKMVDGSLEPLTNDNYISGQVYDVYINSQDVAIITTSDLGLRALSEVSALSSELSSQVTRLEGVISSNYNTLDTKIDTNSTNDRAYADSLVVSPNSKITALEELTSAFTKSGNNYTFVGNITAADISAQNLTVTSTVTLSGVTGFTLPSGTTIADPSTATGIANKQWVETLIGDRITQYHADYHYVGTDQASVAMAGKENGSFYYKLTP